MIAFSKPQENNPHIIKLKHVIGRASSRISWAVFADDDPVLLRRLSQALKEESAAIVPAAQFQWDRDEDTLEDAVVWAIEELSVDTLVLVGNSAAGVTATEPILAGQAGAGEAEQGFLESVRAATKKRRLAEEHFLKQVQYLLAVPEISDRLTRESLDLHFLFYRAESGVFVAHDPRDGSFYALID